MLYESVYVSKGGGRAGLECPPRARHRAQHGACSQSQSWALHRQGDNIPILNQSTLTLAVRETFPS